MTALVPLMLCYDRIVPVMVSGLFMLGQAVFSADHLLAVKAEAREYLYGVSPGACREPVLRACKKCQCLNYLKNAKT